MGLQDSAGRSLPTDRHIVRIIRRILSCRTHQYRSWRDCCRTRDRISNGHSISNTNHLHHYKNHQTIQSLPCYKANSLGVCCVARCKYSDMHRSISNRIQPATDDCNIKHGPLSTKPRKPAWNQSSNLRSSTANQHDQASASIQTLNKISFLNQIFLVKSLTPI